LKLKVLSKDEFSNRIAVIVGTRPGIIKFSPIIRELVNQKMNPLIIHAGQHYSYNLDKIFFKELNLPTPNYRVLEMKKTIYHGQQTAKMLVGIEKILLKEKPRVVIVGGDANTNLAGALATRKLGIKLVHLEAGLRSYDWRMPEEHNRVMIDHISDVLLAPTTKAVKNLKYDKVNGKIHLVGNVISDSVLQNRKIAKEKSTILKKLKVEKKKFVLLTLHREENVDNLKIFRSVCDSINSLSQQIDMKIIFPIHPRTKKRIKQFKIKINEKIQLVEPLGYFDFLNLIENSAIVLTDSGGIQEEACILNIPCITLRDNTERPETVLIGANKVVGHNKKLILQETKKFLKNSKKWSNPYGKNVATKIVKILRK
jgi:UDP-N-acetylglucosamine 2-epimerase (non-hydrolysing)